METRVGEKYHTQGYVRTLRSKDRLEDGLFLGLETLIWEM